MHKANISWNNWKYRLRLVYDKYPTDVVRRLHRPKLVKPEDWDVFLAICPRDDEQIKRAKGRESRRHMKLPHTSGRRGAARTEELLVFLILYMYILVLVLPSH